MDIIMKDLLVLREEIDKIDKQIVDLYEKRMEISAGVAEYKINTGKKVFDIALKSIGNVGLIQNIIMIIILILYHLQIEQN